MNKKWFYFLAVLMLPVIRLIVLNTGYDAWLTGVGYTKAGAFIAMLKNSDMFKEFIGGWVFPFYIVGVLAFWCMEEDDTRIGQQFLLLPLAYIPFTILGFTLVNAEFQFSYLYVHPLVIITFGYLYVGFWVMVLGLLSKFGLFR